MKISIEHFAGKYPQFNVSLSSQEGKEPFVVIKGCRIVSGTKGEFVSWPATKNESTGKYWNHVYASEGFGQAVLAEAKKSSPPPSQAKKAAPVTEPDDDIPF